MRYLCFVVPHQKSIVWTYFVRTSDGGKCKLCQVSVKTSGNTTNLKNHLQRRHSEVMESLKDDSAQSRKRKQMDGEVTSLFQYTVVTLLNIFESNSPLS